MPTKEVTVAEFPVRVAESARDATSAHIATIVSVSANGVPEVRLSAAGPAVPARLAFHATRERIETAIVLQQSTVVVFEQGDRSRPIIVGFIQALESSRSEPSSADARDNGAAITARSGSAQPLIEADVDGKRVRVTAQDEIVLQCGSASVTLRRNGRVIIRGTYVETHSEGTNRITGGQVRIN